MSRAAVGGLDQLLAVLALYIAIHVFESNLLQPLLLRGMTSIPPVLILFALVVSFTFFGLLGVMLAAPLTIALMVVVKDLYLHDYPPPPALNPIVDPREAEPGDGRSR